MIYNHIKAQMGLARKIMVPPINYKYDVTQVLVIEGLDLPDYYEVDFCNEGDTGTITIAGTSEGVPIPDDFLLTGKPIKAYVVIAGSQNDVQTRYEITIPVNPRPARTDISPTPAEQLQIDQLIAVIGDAAADAQRSKTAAAVSAEEAAGSALAAEVSAGAAADSATEAEASAASAFSSATAAAASADRAAVSESAAAGSATAAAGSATEAAASAEAAEQSAAQSGYLYFYIGDDGHLYLERTPNTVVDFYLGEDGHLYVREAA